MSSEPVISVQGLGKCYQIYERPRDRLLQMVCRGRKTFYREFWALKNVSFEIQRGETFGVVGANGSGKSTLLQLLCGTLNPTNGSLETTGRIAALLELGSGFNPEFTGRENVYMNAALLGLGTREIDDRFDLIAGFADIGDFLDQPVKTYSSGMMVRLAFAVQAQVEPDILIVDEALAVGDARFQAKCFERLRQLKESGTSILLVTHSNEQIVTHCSRALLLDHGNLVDVGAPRKIVNQYLDILFGKSRAEDRRQNQDMLRGQAIDSKPAQLTRLKLCGDADRFSSRPSYNPHEYRWGDGSVSILDYLLQVEDVEHPPLVAPGQQVSLWVSVRFERSIIRPIFGLTLKTKEGVTVYGANSETLDCEAMQDMGLAGSVIVVESKFTCRLAPGDYFLSLGIASRSGEEIIPHDRRYDSIHLQVAPNGHFFGLADLDLKLHTQTM